MRWRGKIYPIGLMYLLLYFLYIFLMIWCGELLHVVLRYTYNCVSAIMLCLCIILTSSITPLPRPLFLIHCYILQIFTFSTTRTCSSQSLCRRNSTIRKLHNLLDQLSWLERPTVNREVISSILISSEHFFFVWPFLFFCLSYTFLEFGVQAIYLRNQPLCFIFIVYHTNVIYQTNSILTCIFSLTCIHSKVQWKIPYPGRAQLISGVWTGDHVGCNNHHCPGHFFQSIVIYYKFLHFPSQGHVVQRFLRKVILDYIGKII